MPSKITVDELVEIAKAAEEGGPIDWGSIPQTKEHVYRVMASAIIEQFGDVEIDKSRALILLASLVQSQVENMVLHAQLEDFKKKYS